MAWELTYEIEAGYYLFLAGCNSLPTSKQSERMPASSTYRSRMACLAAGADKNINPSLDIDPLERTSASGKNFIKDNSTKFPNAFRGPEGLIWAVAPHVWTCDQWPSYGPWNGRWVAGKMNFKKADEYCKKGGGRLPTPMELRYLRQSAFKTSSAEHPFYTTKEYNNSSSSLIPGFDESENERFWTSRKENPAANPPITLSMIYSHQSGNHCPLWLEPKFTARVNEQENGVICIVSKSDFKPIEISDGCPENWQ